MGHRHRWLLGLAIAGGGLVLLCCSPTEESGPDGPDGGSTSSSGASGSSGASSSSGSSGASSSSGSSGGDGGGMDGGDAGQDSGADGGPTSVGTTCGTVNTAWAADGDPIFDLRSVADRRRSAVVGTTAVVANGTDEIVRWNLATATVIDRKPGRTILPTTGAVYGHVDMAQTTLQIRDIVTDAILATGPYTAGMETKLEATGAYTWTTNINGPAAAITIASPTGAPLVTVPRSGYKSSVFAAPTQFRFAQDNADGTGTLKLYPLDGTPPTQVLYFGTVIGWANDGNHFMTNDGTIVHVYSKAGVLVRDVAGPGTTAGGWGTNLWFANGTLPGTKARVFTTAPNDAGTLITGGTFEASGRYVVFGETIMDFGVTPPKAVAIGPRPNPFVTTELSHIAFDPNGSGQGLMVDEAGVVQAFHLTSGQGELYGCGGVTSITGAANGKVVFGTASGHLVVLDVNAKTASISRRPTSFVALAPDGSKLVHGGPKATSYGDFDVSQLALPGLAVVQTYGKAKDVAIDATGTTLGLTTTAGMGSGTWTVKGVDTNATLATGSWTNNDDANDAFSTGLNPLFALAPDATHFAIWTSGGSARIYANNVLSTTAAGNPLGWLSNQKLVTSSGIYDVNGTKVGNATFPGTTRRRFQRITDNSVYFPAYDVVIDQSTGSVVVPSSGGTPGATSGAVAGAMIVARPSNRSVLGMRALGVVP